MGETDQGADQLDREIWGSDNEDENGDEGKNEISLFLSNFFILNLGF